MTTSESTQGHGPADDALVDRLVALLRPAPERLLIAGLEAPARDATVVTVLDHTAEASFDAAVVDARPIAMDAGMVARLHHRLGPEGLVITVAEVAGPVGNLAPASEPSLRQLVAVLSEGGFSVLRIRSLGTGHGGTVAAVVARRDRFATRSARAGDEDAIIDLFHRCFHPERKLEGWRWRYREAPPGPGPISLAVDDDGGLAGHYGGYPVQLRADGRAWAALHVGDTMTAPEHRDVGRGGSTLLARTVRHFFTHARDGRYGLFYGFNTGPIQRFCEWFIGGSRLSEVVLRRRSAEARPVLETSRYRVRAPDRIGGSFDRFFERAAPHYGLLVARDRAHLQWRYRRSPEATYVLLTAHRLGRMVGWSVFRRVDDVLIWGDALFDPRHVAAAAAILSHALDHPIAAGARAIEGWFGRQPPWWDRALGDLGFSIVPEPQGLGLVYLAEDDDVSKLVAERFYYAKGDSDLF